jgi:uncharacterized protein YjbI with pentapeptide repeats
LFAAILFGDAARGDIFRWDNRQLIPGTQGIVPGPGANLSGYDLDFADFQTTDLTAAHLRSRLTRATFANANLSGADFLLATLVETNFGGAIVTDANLLGATTLGGFTKEQLYTTASYLAKDLRGIKLGGLNLQGAWVPSDLGRLRAALASWTRR